IILASSGNPREFVQRRGRLLRRSAGKEIAIIYDMVVLGSGEEYESINRSELKRVKEFTSAACNRSALEVKYNYLFDKYLEEEHDGKL
ncbi:MAG: DEAD/DEAH box helicase family protein, partial [Lactococcus cremoris]